ncbi:hypothetical protein DDN44_04425 [Vibrio cholerae]|nr:hypothetical protein [Vibrio cholerae]
MLIDLAITTVLMAKRILALLRNSEFTKNRCLNSESNSLVTSAIYQSIMLWWACLHLRNNRSSGLFFYATKPWIDSNFLLLCRVINLLKQTNFTLITCVS